MKKPPKFVRDGIRAALGLAIAAFLIWKVFKDSDLTIAKLGATIAGSRLELLIAALLIFGTIVAITAHRWRLLLRVQGVELPFWTVFRLTMIGIFFSLLIPGAVGGDLIKMVYVSQQAPAKASESILSIMLDRVIGLLGLCLVTLVAVLLTVDFVRQADWQIQVFVLFVGAASFGAVGGVLAVFFRQPLLGLPGVRHLVEWGRAKLPAKAVEIVDRLARALDLYRRRPWVLAQALALSAVVHSILSLTVLLLGLGYGIAGLGARFYFFATQLANAIGAIPLAPMGAGQRDKVLQVVLEAVGAAPEKTGAVAISLTLIMVVWSLIGGLFFIFSRLGSRQTQATVDKEAATVEAG